MNSLLLSKAQTASAAALGSLHAAARADSQAWGQALEGLARAIAVVAVACFVAGEALGHFVHAANAKLAAAYRCLLVGHQAASAVAEPLLEAATETAAAALSALTVQQLRSLARQQLGSAARIEGRRIAQARRAALVQALA
jgi:hypothetical protein